MNDLRRVFMVLIGYSEMEVNTMNKNQAIFQSALLCVFCLFSALYTTYNLCKQYTGNIRYVGGMR